MRQELEEMPATRQMYIPFTTSALTPRLTCAVFTFPGNSLFLLNLSRALDLKTNKKPPTHTHTHKKTSLLQTMKINTSSQRLSLQNRNKRTVFGDTCGVRRWRRVEKIKATVHRALPQLCVNTFPNLAVGKSKTDNESKAK